MISLASIVYSAVSTHISDKMQYLQNDSISASLYDQSNYIYIYFVVDNA